MICVFSGFRINLPHSKQKENKFTTAQTHSETLKHRPDRRADTSAQKQKKALILLLLLISIAFLNTISPHLIHSQLLLQLISLLNT